AEVDVVGGDRVQVFRLVGTAAADGAALDPDGHVLRRGVPGAVDVGRVEPQVDRVAVEGFSGGLFVEVAQQAFGLRDQPRVRSGHAEHVAAIGDLDAEPQLDLAQM